MRHFGAIKGVLLKNKRFTRRLRNSETLKLQNSEILKLRNQTIKHPSSPFFHYND